MQPELIGGRYRVQSAIGQGGMGTVWLCRDETLHREVAVKQVGLLPGESVTDSARAFREARSSAALSHRNVVTVFDVVEEDGAIWLVMEHVPGRSLSEIIKRGRPARARGGRRHRRPGGRRARRRPRGRHHAPRREARQRADPRGRRGEDQRLRHRPLRRRPGAHPVRLPHRHPELLLPRARPWRRARLRAPTCGPWARRCTPPSRAGRPTSRGPTRSRCCTTSPPASRRRRERADFLEPALLRMMDRNPDSRWSMDDAAHGLHRLADAHTAGRTREHDRRRRRPDARRSSAGPRRRAGARGRSGRPARSAYDERHGPTQPRPGVRRAGGGRAAPRVGGRRLRGLASAPTRSRQRRRRSAAGAARPRRRPRRRAPEVEEPLAERQDDAVPRAQHPDASPTPTRSTKPRAGRPGLAAQKAFLADYFAQAPGGTDEAGPCSPPATRPPSAAAPTTASGARSSRCPWAT